MRETRSAYHSASVSAAAMRRRYSSCSGASAASRKRVPTPLARPGRGRPRPHARRRSRSQREPGRARPRRRQPARAATWRPGPRHGRLPPSPARPPRRRRPRPPASPPRRSRPSAARAHRHRAPDPRTQQGRQTRARRSVTLPRAHPRSALADPRRRRNWRRRGCSSSLLSHGRQRRGRQARSTPASRVRPRSKQRRRAEGPPPAQSALAQAVARSPTGRRRAFAPPNTTSRPSSRRVERERAERREWQWSQPERFVVGPLSYRVFPARFDYGWSGGRAACSRSRNGICAGFSLRRASSRANHSTRSISGNVSTTPECGGHSIS